MFHVKQFVRIAALFCIVGLGACAGVSTTQILNDIKTACLLIPIGTTFFVSFTSSIPLLVNINPIVQTIGQTATNDCDALVTAVQNAINAINSAGGTATVNVSTSNGSPATVRLLTRKLMARYPTASLKMTGARSLSFTVPPHIF